MESQPALCQLSDVYFHSDIGISDDVCYSETIYFKFLLQYPRNVLCRLVGGCPGIGLTLGSNNNQFSRLEDKNLNCKLQKVTVLFGSFFLIMTTGKRFGLYRQLSDF
jgi:hypothetical protein